MITTDRLRSLIDAYGTDPERWPADERAAARLLLANSAEAQAYARAAEALDSLLDRVPLTPLLTVDPAALAGRITRVPASRPAARAAWFARPSFGWANFAALAAAAVVGFVVGWTDLSANTTAANRDIVDAISPAAAADDSVW